MVALFEVGRYINLSASCQFIKELDFSASSNYLNPVLIYLVPMSRQKGEIMFYANPIFVHEGHKQKEIKY